MKVEKLFAKAVAVFFLLPVFTVAHANGADKTSPSFKQNKLLMLHADLDAAAALPGNSEPASGSIEATYDPSSHVLRFYGHFVGLSGPATNARFHGPAAFDRSAGAIVAAPRPEARLVEGTAWLDREQELDLLEGRWYFNVTTEKHPAGEIRGMVHLQTADPQ